MNAPHQQEHDLLAADLAGRMNLRGGLAEILDTAGGHAGLVADLTAGLDTERGLAAILTRMAAEPEVGSDPLEALRVAPAHQRLLLRAGDRHRYLSRATRTLDDIDRALSVLPGDANPLVDLKGRVATELLERQRGDLVAAFARSVASAGSRLRYFIEALVQAESLLRSEEGIDRVFLARLRAATADLSREVREIWDAVSRFEGADLRPAIAVSVEDLDGVWWSDSTARCGPTLWPDHLRAAVAGYSEPAAEDGVSIVRYGAQEFIFSST